MSNHAARPESSQHSRWSGVATGAGIPALVVLTLVLGPLIYRNWFLPDRSWPSFPARVLATRVVPVGTVENPFGTSFLYRLEIDASWNENGVTREAWVPTKKVDRDRSWLLLWASRQGKTCTIRSGPRNPSATIAFF